MSRNDNSKSVIKLFKDAGEFRSWLEQNHDKAKVLQVRFYKKTSGRSSITYPEALDQALCFGWIDGVRNAVDELSYTIRFTPRRPRSIWSAINIRKVEELIRAGLMQPSGLKAFESRTDERSEVYSFERKRKQQFDPAFAKMLRDNEKAYAFFEAQIPSYRRTVIHWVMSAKKEETRLRRMETLIADSAKGLWVAPMRSAQRRR